MRFKKGTRFISKLNEEWEVVQYDDTDEMYLCKETERSRGLNYFYPEEIEKGLVE